MGKHSCPAPSGSDSNKAKGILKSHHKKLSGNNAALLLRKISGAAQQATKALLPPECQAKHRPGYSSLQYG